MNSFLLKTLSISLRQNSSVLLKAELSTTNKNDNHDSRSSGDSLLPLNSSSTPKYTALSSNKFSNSSQLVTTKDNILGNLSERKQLNERVNFLNSKSINVSEGWNNLQVKICKQAEQDFYLNSESGKICSIVI